jgi:hypothetical protein
MIAMATWHHGLAAMTLVRCHKFDVAMLVLVVAPLDK